MANIGIRRRLMLLGLGLVLPGVGAELRKRARKRLVRSERVAAGLCRDCGKEPFDGCHIRCRGCREKHAFARSERKLFGLCYDCGGAPEAGRTRCSDCRRRANGDRSAKWRRRLVRPCPTCGEAQLSGRRRLCSACAERKKLRDQEARRVWARAKGASDKALVWAHYGGKCSACGEDRPGFLNVDHVHDDGYMERHPGGKRVVGAPLYSRIIRKGFPDTYQLLCYHCNSVKNARQSVSTERGERWARRKESTSENWLS